MSRAATAARRSYEIVGFEMCDPWQLEPHPAAAVPIDDEDRAAIERSIDDAGAVMAPLLVEADFHDSPEANEGKARFVLDGCNRLRVVREQMARKIDAGTEQGTDFRVPCVLVHAKNPRAVALECLMGGRKRSTGQRVLAYIEMHKAPILNAAEAANGGRANLHKSLKKPEPHGEAPGGSDWSAEAIAERLKCSRDDVMLGIQLTRENETETDPQRREILRRTRDAVLAGGSPIRRWKAAVGGASADQHGRKSADYASCILRACTSLESAWKNFPKVNQRELGTVTAAFAEMIAAAPDVMLTAVAQAIAALPEEKSRHILGAIRGGGRH